MAKSHAYTQPIQRTRFSNVRGAVLRGRNLDICLRYGRSPLLFLRRPKAQDRLEASRITIAHTLADDGTLAEPKRERSRRTIVLPPAAVAAIRAHKAAQAAHQLAKGPLYLDQGFVFADEVVARGSSIARQRFSRR